MIVDYKNNNDGTARLELTLQRADWQKDYTKKLAQVASTVKVNGFRPGKYPVALAEKQYGPSVKVDIINETINKAISDYLKENKINYLGDLVPDEESMPAADDSIRVAFTLGLTPEFELPALDSITVPFYKAQFTQDEANERIKSLQRRNGKLVDVDVSTAKSIVSATIVYPGQDEVKSYISLERALPESVDVFVGKHVRDSIDVDLSTVFSDEELRKLLYIVKNDDPIPTGIATVTINRIQEFADAPLDHAFGENVLGLPHIDSEDEIVAAFTEKLSENLEKDYQALAERDLLKQLRDNVDLQLPAAFLEPQIRHSYEHEKKEYSQEQLQRELEMLTNSLILDKLADTLDVSVEYADVVEETKAAIVGSGYVPPSTPNEELEEMAKRILADKDRSTLRSMMDRARTSKILGTALKAVQKVPKMVSYAELAAIANQA